MNKKKSNKKIYIIFIAVMVALYGIGYLTGKLLAKGENSGNLEHLITSLKQFLVNVTPPLYALLAIISLFLVWFFYFTCKKMHRELQKNPDDAFWDLLEYKMNVPIILANAMQILNVFFFGCILCITEFASYGKDGGFETAVVIIDCILFLLILVVTILVSGGIVKIEKELNPEKQGNVFDFRFNEVWFESCDEAQKMIVYKASYHAFKCTNITCMVLWIASFVGMFALKTGIYPLLCVCLIWLVNTLSYMLRAAKLERGK
ncbi:MAG: DUF3169 family protein [Eubacterium sp.]|nr:DUF3169 family protein [Eubacterium sp.]